MDAVVDSSNNLMTIGISLRQKKSGEFDEYALICAIDSRRDMETIARKIIKEYDRSKTDRDHLARWKHGGRKQHFFLGDYGKGGLQWIDPYRQYRRYGNSRCECRDKNGELCKRYQWINPEVKWQNHCIEDIAIHTITFLKKKLPGRLSLEFRERDFGDFRVPGGFSVKAQLWCREKDDWRAASGVFKKEYSE